MTVVYLETMLDQNTIVADGNPKPVGDKDLLVIQVIGLVAGDVVQIEGSNDEGLRPDGGGVVNWSIIQTGGSDDITANGIYELSPVPNWIRAKRTAIVGGGTVTVKLKGQIT